MKTDNKNTVSDKVACYCLLSDSYKKRYKIKYRVFRWILQHMETCLGEDAVIWILMQEVKNNRG